MRSFGGGRGFESKEGKVEVLVGFVLILKYVFARNLQSLWTFTTARRCMRRRWDCLDSKLLSFSRRTDRDGSLVDLERMNQTSKTNFARRSITCKNWDLNTFRRSLSLHGGCSTMTPTWVST